MILEAVITTLDRAGTLNVAPMGPELMPGSNRFVLRPYQTSTTFRNLAATGAGVCHITDDVWLIARAAIRQLDLNSVSTRPAERVLGRILDTTGRYLEFRVLDLDTTTDRARITVATVASGRQANDLFGLNRARHAVVEAAILATRLDFLPHAEILHDLALLAPLVTKTGGPDEHRAFNLLYSHVQNHLGRS